MPSARPAVASAIGWTLVALVAVMLFGVVVGAIKLLLRTAVFVLVLGGMLWVYLVLKEPDD